MKYRMIARTALLAILAAPLTAGCGSSDLEDPEREGVTPGGGKGDVYGIDDRAESYQAGPGTLERRLARASAMLTDSTNFVEELGPEGELEGYRLSESVQLLRDSVGLCEEERFSDQPAVGFCSATLVAPDLVATSGHCIASERALPEDARCEDVRIVFGFGYESANDDPMGAFERVATDDVYGCKKVEAIGWIRSPENQDWALIRLDRPVVDRDPIPVLGAAPATGLPVLQIGHPTGIPQKLAMGVVTNRSDYEGYEAFEGNTFTYTSDLFGGNSGGGVFDLDSAALAGIPTLYSGRNYSYDSERQCYVPGICGVNTECTYPPGAFATHRMLEHLGESNPELIDELVVLGATDPGPDADAGAGSDAGSADAGSFDGGSADAGSADAGSADAGSADAGGADAGF